MKTGIRTGLWLCAALLLSGCSLPDETAGADVLGIAHSDVDQLPEGIRSGEADFMGAIVYGDRGYTGLTGNRMYPNIRVNGQSIGKCEKRRAMVIPLPPGDHLVSAHSENAVERPITLAEGEVAYFRCNFLRIGGILFPPAVLAPASADDAYAVVNR